MPRGSNGYRLFNEEHLFCLRLARTALGGDWPGRDIRRSAAALAQTAAAGDGDVTLAAARRHLALIRDELARAEAAAAVLETWPADKEADPDFRPLRVKEAAALLAVSPDMLRNWEKNGLLETARDPANGYRLYGPVEIARLRVIRLLIQAGFGVAAILRAFTHLDAGRAGDPRAVLDTPPPEEDIHHATDRWLTTLADQERRAGEIVALIELTPVACASAPSLPRKRRGRGVGSGF